MHIGQRCDDQFEIGLQKITEFGHMFFIECRECSFHLSNRVVFAQHDKIVGKRSPEVFGVITIQLLQKRALKGFHGSEHMHFVVYIFGEVAGDTSDFECSVVIDLELFPKCIGGAKILFCHAFRNNHLTFGKQGIFWCAMEKLQGKEMENGGIGKVHMIFEKDLFIGFDNTFFFKGNQPGHLDNCRDLLFHDRAQAGAQLCMNILIIGQIYFATKPVDTIPRFQMFIEAVLISHMGVDEE